MNYAVQSASAVSFQPKRASLPIPKLLPPTLPTALRRITINVGGERFQTYEETLARYPGSLLGSSVRRREFYNLARDEYVFPERNKEIFNAILFFYQAKILSRPERVPLETFAREVKFFGLAGYCNEVPPTLTQGASDLAGTFPENNTFRNRLWNFLEKPRTRTERYFSKFNLLMVFAWIVVQCAQTEVQPTFLTGSGTTNESSAVTKGEWTECSKEKREEGCWFVVDTLFVTWFTIDYLMHIIAAPSLARYIPSLPGIIDLLTILPYYLHLLVRQFGTTLSPQVQVLAFLRILRLFKASRYSSSFRILVGSLVSSAHDLPVWLILVVMHIFFFSSVVFYIEWEFGNPQFSSIPEAMWFIIITMCAVGYGDVVPQSIPGKFVTAFAAVSGIVIVFCIPAPTLKKNFNRLNELYKSQKQEKKLQANGSHRNRCSHSDVMNHNSHQ